jgi:hypothetical protein
MSQGQGPSTPRKQQGLRMAFRQGLLITKNFQRPYWHIDMHAGSGINDKAGCPGSPLVFLEEAKRVGRPFHAYFCENDPVLFRRLSDNLRFAVEGTDQSSVCCSSLDNAHALRLFAERIASEDDPKTAAGTLLLDPNGFSRRSVPLDALKDFFSRFRRIDAVLNLNISLFSKVDGCRGHPTIRGFDDWPHLSDVCGLGPFKTHWLVRNPSRGGRGDRFALFLGRNTDRGMARFADFVPLDSERGQLIVRHYQRFRPEQPLFPGWED